MHVGAMVGAMDPWLQPGPVLHTAAQLCYQKWLGYM